MENANRKYPGYREAKSHLYVMDVLTRDVREIAFFDYLIEAPNWLADGRLLYNAQGRICTIDPATGAREVIDTGECAACNNDHVVSFDGSTLAVSSGGPSRIYALPISGGTPRLITPQGPLYLHGISPDCATIAYCAERSGEYDVYTMPFEGGPETRLTFSEGLNDGPEYSPDGRYIWFNSVREGNMQLFRMLADGSEQTRMHASGRNDWFAHISPDGKLCAYISFGTDVAPGAHPANKEVELRLMDADGQNDRLLTPLFGGQGTMNVNSWAPDSRHLAYVHYDRPQ